MEILICLGKFINTFKGFYAFHLKLLYTNIIHKLESKEIRDTPLLKLEVVY